MSTAYDNPASVYDHVYEQAYGTLYEHFTDLSLNTIHGIIDSGTIIEFGVIP